MSEMQKARAIFGGGCFWCTEAVFKMIKGISSVLPGYAISQGEKDKGIGPPTYEEVSLGDTPYAESVEVEYDPDQVDYRDLLTIFFASHDPTSLDRQGSDVGHQYRSAIFYTTPEQREEAAKLINEINASNPGGPPVITELSPLGGFYEAEDYHKNYFETHQDSPYCLIVINPKLEKVQKRFSDLLKREKIT